MTEKRHSVRRVVDFLRRSFDEREGVHHTPRPQSKVTPVLLLEVFQEFLILKACPFGATQSLNAVCSTFREVYCLSEGCTSLGKPKETSTRFIVVEKGTVQEINTLEVMWATLQYAILFNKSLIYTHASCLYQKS